MDLIEAIKQDNQEEFFRLLNLQKNDLSGNGLIDEIDAKYEGNALYWAIAYGHFHFIEPLLQAGADVNYKIDVKYEGNALYWTIAYGRLHFIESFLKAGTDVNHAGNDTFTPIYIAAQQRHWEAIPVLLEAGADASVKTKWGTVLEMVNRRNTPESAEITRLLEAHLKQYPNGIKPQTNYGHAHSISHLFEADANINKQEKDTRTLAYEAAQNEHVEVIAALKAAGANVKIPKTDSIATVFIAAQMGNAMVGIASLKKANTNMKTPEDAPLEETKKDAESECSEAVRLYPNGIKAAKGTNKETGFSVESNLQAEPRTPPITPSYQNKLDSPQRHYEQGQEFEKQKDFLQAFKCYQKSAESGYLKARTQVGLFYLTAPNKIIPEDKPKAFKYLFQSAKEGHTRAMYNVAMMLEFGDGVFQNIPEAFVWYKKVLELEPKNTEAARKCEKLKAFAPTKNHQLHLDCN